MHMFKLIKLDMLTMLSFFVYQSDLNKSIKQTNKNCHYLWLKLNHTQQLYGYHGWLIFCIFKAETVSTRRIPAEMSFRVQINRVKFRVPTSGNFLLLFYFLLIFSYPDPLPTFGFCPYNQVSYSISPLFLFQKVNKQLNI